MILGGLMTCTWPQRWPVLLPRSRNQRPPGQASSLKGKGLPSGIWLSGPSCSRMDSKAMSMGASMKISFWIFIDEICSLFTCVDVDGEADVVRLIGILPFLVFFAPVRGLCVRRFL